MCSVCGTGVEQVCGITQADTEKGMLRQRQSVVPTHLTLYAEPESHLTGSACGPRNLVSGSCCSKHNTAGHTHIHKAETTSHTQIA